MFALPGLICLLVFMYLRPQEHYQLLQKVPLLYMFFAAAVGGLIVDLRLRLIKPVPARSLFIVVLFIAWCVVTIAVEVPGPMKISGVVSLTIVFVTYVLLCQGVQSFRALHVVAATMIGIGLFLSVIGVHQAFAPLGCVRLDDVLHVAGTPDGRSCETSLECLGVHAEPGATYDCQRIGLFGTVALDNRVRYRGDLQDPNNLALVISATVPFLFAFAQRKRRPRVTLLAVAGTLLMAACVFFTGSRGGQLAFMAVLGVYFARHCGMKSVLAAALLGLVVVAVAGRSGQEASASTMGRYEAWRAGLYMLEQDPILGVGHDMFTQHHYLTAHNAHVLAAAELGLIGMFLWVSILYITVKVPLVALRDFADRPEAEPARVWAGALLAMCAAYGVQMMFLSLTYHTITWVLFGLSGAYYSAVKRHVPDWHVRFGIIDMGLVAIICAAFIIGLHLFLRFMGF